MTARWTSLLLLLCLLATSVRARFFLLATFVTYNNSLATVNGTGNCCFNDCSPNACDTILRYCFKEYGAQVNISNDQQSSSGCIDVTRSSRILSNIVSIDYATRNTRSSLTYRPSEWPGRLQFFVRALVGSVLEYFVLDFELQVGDNSLSTTINGTVYASNMTFTVSLSLMCLANFFGPNCSVECVPQNSDDLGHYTCLSNGSKECLPGYGGDNCDIDMDDICGHTSPCNSSERCTNTGNSSYNCTPLPTPLPTISNMDDICGHTSPCKSSERCTNTGNSSYNCTPISTPLPTISTSTPSSASVAPLVAGVTAGIVLLLIILCVLTMLVIVGLKRRMHTQTVDMKGGREEKSANGTPYGHDSVLGLMDNPMYEVSMKGTHLPLGNSPSVEVGVEYDVDNPLYMMGIQDAPLADGVVPIHEYEYDDIALPLPSCPPTLSSELEGGVYAEPDVILHTLPPSLPPSLPPPLPPPPPSSSPPSHHYMEPDAKPAVRLGPTPQPDSTPQSDHTPWPDSTPQSDHTPQPGPIYDAPLLLDKKASPPPASDTHYETADVVTEACDTSHIYDSEKEEM